MMKNNTIAYNFAIMKVAEGRTKNLLVSLFFLLVWYGFGNSASAQDLLILKSGEEMKVVIIEEGTDIIRFRDFEDPAGPLYSINKDKVATVKYKKGSKNAKGKQEEEQVEQVPVEKEKPVHSSDPGTLECRKRIVMSGGKKLSVRKVKTLMEDYPDA